MRKFTPTEIDLCKKIAEKERKKLKLGDWMVIKYPSSYGNIEPVTLFDTKWVESPNRFPDTPAVYNCSTDCYHKDFFPLWQEHDCLAFLSKQYEEVSIETYDGKKWESSAYIRVKKKDAPVIAEVGDTPLECLLRAVLAVMEGK